MTHSCFKISRETENAKEGKKRGRKRQRGERGGGGGKGEPQKNWGFYGILGLFEFGRGDFPIFL